jgi:hypothetical protein
MQRKRFLAVAGSSALAAAAAEQLLGMRAALGAPFTRQDVGGLTAASKHIKSYAKAVAAMKKLPDTDPTSWKYQAAIHWTTLSPLKTSWDSCQHGNAFFWSWHRMYIYWFERIVRKKSGDPSFALPYWAWDSPSERQLPPMFRDKTSTLYRAWRDPNMNNGTGSLPAWAVDTSTAFATSVFSTPLQTGASDLFQGTPHGSVHVLVNGGMHDVQTAAPDPIFYLHHANVDRLWEVWRASFGGVDPISDSSWTGKTWTFFNENGKPVTMSACQILNAAQQLNYVYEGGPSPPLETCPSRFIRIPIYEYVQFVNPPIPPLGQKPVTIPLPIPPEQRQSLTNRAPSSTENIYLQLLNVQASSAPNVVWQVYVGSTTPASAAMTRNPSAENNPHYVGNVVLFGLGVKGGMPTMPATLSFKINRALLASQGPLTITFIPAGILINDQPSHPQVRETVQIGKMRVVVETIKQG